MIEKNNLIKGSLYALAAFFFMALFGILTKIALHGSAAIWVSFIAYLTGAVALMPFIIQKGVNFLKSQHYSYLIGRALIGTLASLLYTISIHYIPIVNGTLLFNTAPIFIPLLAVCFLKAKIEQNIWLAVAIGFIGIIIIIKPTEAIFTQTGNLIGILSGVSLAIAYLLMKQLTYTDPGIRIIFYYLGLGTIVQIPLLLFTQSLPSLESSIYAIISGIMLLLAQILLVNSYKYAEASQVGVYQYSSVAFVALLDWLLWNSIPNNWDLIGIALVTLAGVVIIRSNKKI
jgi:drug/metabolite transporter (DMT)-like permease